jgi:manganese transport protein
MPPPPTADVAFDDLPSVAALPTRCEAYKTIAMPTGAGRFWRKLGAFAGPGCLVQNWGPGFAFGYAYSGNVSRGN